MQGTCTDTTSAVGDASMNLTDYRTRDGGTFSTMIRIQSFSMSKFCVDVI